MSRRFWGNAALALAALAISFGVAEIAVRALYADESTLFPRYHTDYRYGPYVLRGIRANADFVHTSPDGSWRFVTNSHGFRNEREFAYEKPAGVVRVLAVGDSHTQGYEVRQQATFSAVLERALAARGLRAEVINAGVSGFSNAEELAFVEHEGVRYHPDVVVLGFFANDYEDNLKAALFKLDDKGTLMPAKYEHIPGVSIQNFIYRIPGVQWLGEHSYFYSMLFNEVWNFFKFRLAAQATQQAPDAPADAKAGDAPEYAVPTTSSLSPYQTSLATKLLLRMNEVCKANGVRLIVVDIPDYVSAYHARPSLVPALTSALDAAGVEYVPSERLVGAYDGAAEMHVAHGHHHISEFTHALIGAELAQRIVARMPTPGGR